MKQLILAALSAALLSACATDPMSRSADPTSAWDQVSRDPNAPNGAIFAAPMTSAPLDASKTLSRIIFASCAHQLEDQSLWDVMTGAAPDLTLYIGDNVYGDVRSNDPALPELKAAYMRLGQSQPFKRLRDAAPMLTMWDDHDYGMNDGGGGYHHKVAAEALYEYVWDIDDQRAERPGVYGSWIIGEAGKKIQVVMLDTRFFRSDLTPTDDFNAPGKERYIPDADPTKTMLGDAQWAWLADELQKPADLRLLVSSVQVIADGHGWEAWKMLPTEREKLYSLIAEAGAENTIILSGDRHAAAFYRLDDVAGAPLFEATSSSVNLPVSGFSDNEYVQEPGPRRLTDMTPDVNYGLLEIDWEMRDVLVSIRGADGEVVFGERVSFGGGD